MNRKTIIIIAIAAIVAVVICLFTCKDKVKEVKRDLQGVAAANSEDVKYRDMYETEHEKRLETETSLSTMKILHDSELQDMQKRLGIKDKQIKAFQAVGITSSNTIDGETSVVPGNGKKDTVTSFSDKSFKGKVKWGKKPVLSYTFHDSIVLVHYTKKKWLFGRQYDYVDAYSLAEHSDITGLKAASVSIKEPSRWNISIFGGINTNLKPVVGVGISYSIFRF